MTLSEFIKQYRKQHGLSIRAFAAMAGISLQQISNIEKGIGNNGKPMTSTMSTYKKIANAIGMSEQDFLNMLNDDVSVNPNDEEAELAHAIQILRDKPESRAMLSVYDSMDADDVRMMQIFIEGIRKKHDVTN